MAAFLFHNTKGVKFGTDFNHLTTAQFRTPGGRALSETELFSNIYADTLDDDSGFDGAICWESAGPWPVNVLALGGFVQTQDQ
jgi:hypothetical protein